MLIFLIKEIRKIKKISLKQLQEKTDISISYLSNIENNKVKNPSLFVIVKIAQALEMKLDDLYFVYGEINSMKKALNIFSEAYGLYDERTIKFSKEVNKVINKKI